MGPICQRCKRELPEGAKFCYNCGRPVPAAACPKCGFSKLSPIMKFCPMCGAPLTAQADKQEIGKTEESRTEGAMTPQIIELRVNPEESRTEGALTAPEGGSEGAPNAGKPAAGSKGFISKFWNGDYSLPMMYWGYGVFLQFVVFICFLVVIGPISTGSSSDNAALIAGIAVLAGMLIYCVYCVLWSVGTWRSASKYSGPHFWAVLAKIAVVLGVLLHVKDLLQAFTDFSG
ncbi:MAG: zinc ribbon domain-containing protein [Mailhella sp.]|nr:zinc ribbon domain-containing protein [Mailhella sp.]